jgi:hypothetical protein
MHLRKFILNRNLNLIDKNSGMIIYSVNLDKNLLC